MNAIVFLALWLQMSAPPQTGSVTLVKTCNVGEWVNDEINCKDPQGWHMVNKRIDQAADETDGKPPNYYDSYGNSRYPVEPVDVPAVQQPQLPDLKWCGDHMKTDAGYSICLLHIAQNPPKTTCSDKSRVLLTSEDGKKHCIKFE
jgi:hypothetical protein